jgi:8-oxo-dGTP diphosphatase
VSVQSEPQVRLWVAAALVWCEGRLLLQRRAITAKHGAGKLEFPGGKIEPGESAEAALARELIEEWGPAAADLVVGEIATVIHHIYPVPGPEVQLLLYSVEAPSWQAASWQELVTAETGVGLEDYAVEELPIEDFLEADQELVRSLMAGRFR